MTRADLQQLARERLREARALLRLGLWDSAYFLSGFAVECALKACIAKNTRRSEFPDLSAVKGFWTHDLAKLRKAAGLEKAFEQDATRDSQLGRYWALVKDWRSEARYQSISETKARDFYDPLTKPQRGVMTWLRQRW
jgi:HEPN domain-containing protein